MSLIDVIRSIVRQSTVKVNGAVENIHGEAVAYTLGNEGFAEQSWRWASLPATELLDFTTLNARLTPDLRWQYQITDGGELFLTSAAGGAVVLVTAVDLVQAQSATFLVETQGPFAFYLDGVLQKRAYSTASVPLQLEPGKHTLVVMSLSPSTKIVAPATLALNADSVVIGQPAIVAATTTYSDVVSGTAKVLLEWTAVPFAAGYTVYRREPISSGATISSIDGLSRTNTLALTLNGAYAASFPTGTEVFAGGTWLGTVNQSSDDGTNTYVRVMAQPGLTELPVVTGQTVNVGRFVIVGRVEGSFNGTVSMEDATVAHRRVYQYAVRAYGYDPGLVLGPMSDVYLVNAGDTSPPGSVVIVPGYPLVNNGVADVRVTAPSDSDFEGVNVYRRVNLTGYTVSSVSGATINVTPATLPSVVDYYVSFAGVTGTFRVQSNTSGQVTLTTTPLTTPANGAAITLFGYTKIATAFGKASQRLQVLFGTLGYGEYRFPTFDIAGNQQPFSEAYSWNYTAADDQYTSGPVVSVRQVTSTEQAFFSGLTDPSEVVILEIYASQPAKIGGSNAEKTAGITLYYRRKGDVADTSLSPIPFSADAFPRLVTTATSADTGTSRYVSLPRVTDNQWIQVWAVDAQGYMSDRLTFVADYDVTPEITSLETRVDSSNDTVNFTVVVDDDTYGVRYWVSPANPGEPSQASPGHLNMTTTNIATIGGILLPAGSRKVLTCVPYSAFSGGVTTGSSGEVVSRDLVRTPKSMVTVDDKDPQGLRGSEYATLTFSMFPSPTLIASGTLTSATTTVLTDTSKTWTTNQFLSSNLNHYFVKILETSTAPAIMRKVLSNTSTSVTVATVPSGLAGRAYEIYDGAVTYRQRTYPPPPVVPADLTPSTGSLTFQRNADYQIDFAAFKTGCFPETIRSIVVDADQRASLVGYTVTVGANNLLVAQFTGADDDAKYWRLYARKGAWPTLNGLVTGTVDDQYLKYSGDTETSAVQFAAGNGTWYTIAVPINSLNESGVRSTASVVVSGATGVAGALTYLGVSLVTEGQTYLTLTYGHNATASGNVTIRVWRQDQGPSSETVLTSTRSVTLDADDTNTTALEGGYRHTISGNALYTTPGSTRVARTFNYRVLLNSNNSTQLGSFTVYEDIGATVPTLTSASISVSEPGSCSGGSPTVPPTCLSPHTRLITFTHTATGNPLYEFHIDRSMNDGPSYTAPAYVTIATGLDSSTVSLTDSTNCLYYTVDVNNPTFVRWWKYRVRLVRVADQATIASVETTTFSDTVRWCS